MQEFDARGGEEGEAEGGVVVVVAVVVVVGSVTGCCGGGAGRRWRRRRGKAFGHASGCFGATDGRISPDGVDFEEAAKGPDDSGEEVDGGGDGEETRRDDGVALGFGFGAHHAVDEFGADLGFGAGDGGRVDEDHFFEADGSVRGAVFGDAVVGVGIVVLLLVGFLFAAGDAVQEVDVGRLGQVHGVADAFGDFAFDALPAGRFGGAGFGLADFFLPFALHLVHFAFFLAFGGFGEGRWGWRVYQETFGDAGGVNAVDLRLGERDEVGDEFVRVAGIVDGA